MLGDRIEQALTRVNVTTVTVTKWLGKPCNCDYYKQKLNQLDVWARKVISENLQRAKEHLKGILEQ